MSIHRALKTFDFQFDTTWAKAATVLAVLAFNAFGQEHRVILGHIHPLARQQYDKGPVEATQRLGLMSVSLKRSARQQAELDQLLEKQQDLDSLEYHQWLTPEQFGERFGATPEDIDKSVRWLESNGFSEVQVSRGRDSIAFTGTANQVEKAFRAQIHSYHVDGAKHYANATEPVVPEELAGVIGGVRGLHDFYPKSLMRRVKGLTSGSGLRPDFLVKQGINLLAPDDLATIYNVNSFYKAGLDGTGQTVVIAGASDIDLADIQTFRASFNLPPNDPQKILVPGVKNPGMNEAMGEADLDLEWAGAIARNATILYVFADDPFLATAYAVDQALAPVISFSFGLCELHTTSGDIRAIMDISQKAAALGITWVVSSGDSGSATCEDHDGGFPAAITRLNVSIPASLPLVTAVGGTQFTESSSNYWSATPGPNLGTALGYIPEAAWNEESLLLQNGMLGYAAGGGGASWIFAKPSWQTGAGVPRDGARDVPDVSFTASAFRNPYTIVTGGDLSASGGTSASAPVFAGMVALLNQYVVATGGQSHPGLGNINPALYALAQTAPSTFHDVSVGNNAVPCVKNSTQDCISGVMGYSAGVGYDLATGLGSVNAFNMALNWRNATVKSAHLTITKYSASTSVRAGGPFTLTLSVKNDGNVNAGAFQIRSYFTKDGTIAPSTPYVHCNETSLAVGGTANCVGTVTLPASVTAGTYILVGVADGDNSVAQTDRSGGFATPSTGPLKVN